MDVQRFVRELTALYHDWGRPTVRPKDDRLDGVLHRVRGMSTVNVLRLLNSAVGCLDEGECYLEVGSFHGATLIGALLGHPHRTAYAAKSASASIVKTTKRAGAFKLLSGETTCAK